MDKFDIRSLVNDLNLKFNLISCRILMRKYVFGYLFVVKD